VVGGDAREGHGGPVHAGHKQAAEDDLVEAGVGTTCSRARERSSAISFWHPLVDFKTPPK
jgi:hypothetical protein